MTDGLLPFTEFLNLTLQVVQQLLTADFLPFLDLIEETVGLIKAVRSGFQRILVLIIQVLDIGSELVVDRGNLIGILLLQIQPLLRRFFLNPLHIGSILLLCLIDFLLQSIDLAIRLLSLVTPFLRLSLDFLVICQLIRQG